MSTTTTHWGESAILGLLYETTMYAPMTFEGITAFTDSRSALIVPAIEGFGESKEGWGGRAVLVGFGQKPEGETTPIETAALRDWTGPVDQIRPEPCDECENGKVKHECDCAYCQIRYEDGECEYCENGVVMKPPPIRTGRFAGMLIDINRLAAFAHAVPDTSLRFRADVADEILWFFGDGWRFLMKPLADGDPVKEYQA